MQIQTMSLIAGTEACNARCPFCISGMTEDHSIGTKLSEINLRNLRKSFSLAEKSSVTTLLITGKGEPTLFPKHIETYLTHASNYNFPFIELQTNGIPIAEGKISEQELEDWYILGLTTVIISVVSYDAELNRKVYLPYKKEYIDLEKLIDKLHKVGLIVRLGVVGIKDGIDNNERLDNMLEFARKNNVEQMTLRPVTSADIEYTKNIQINEWIKENGLSEESWYNITDYVRGKGKLLMKLVHGAEVYDIKGQNICISSCLTLDPNEEMLRQIIFFPNGRLTYDWTYKGAILL